MGDLPSDAPLVDEVRPKKRISAMEYNASLQADTVPPLNDPWDAIERLQEQAAAANAQHVELVQKIKALEEKHGALYQHFTQAFDMLADRIASSRLESTVEKDTKATADWLGELHEEIALLKKKIGIAEKADFGLAGQIDMLADKIRDSDKSSEWRDDTIIEQVDNLRRSVQEEFNLGADKLSLLEQHIKIDKTNIKDFQAAIESLNEQMKRHIHSAVNLRVNDPRGVTSADLENWFRYHAPTSAQVVQYEYLRNAARDFAAIVLTNTPPGPDQTTAIRKIREAVMTANAAIACHVDTPLRRDPTPPVTATPGLAEMAAREQAAAAVRPPYIGRQAEAMEKLKGTKVVGSFLGSDPT